jgi:uncharacterized protein (TIGR00290 family)
MIMERIILSWSGGKDSALALYEIQNKHRFSVSGLLTTITWDYNRTSMHGVREVLLEQQARSAGLPLRKVRIPAKCTDEIYSDIMRKEMKLIKNEGIDAVAFGDIFLRDIRDYRENNLAGVGMKALFPLWGRNTRELMTHFIELGFKAITTVIDPSKLSDDFCGKIIDKWFINKLPENVDPAGENGEFHSFVFEGPIFQYPIHFSVGEKLLRDFFYFCDLLPLE